MRVASNNGYTLIELSIVLLIVSLIAGVWVIVGKELIDAARLRAQVSQIEKYNTAVTTFRLKYNGIPGDLANPATFGLASAGGATAGVRGNGSLEGGCGVVQGGWGESFVFWTHLAQSNLIGDVPPSVTTYDCPAEADRSVEGILPPAKIGRGNYIAASSLWHYQVGNYFAISGIRLVAANHGENYGMYIAEPSLTPHEAFNIDSKIDDGNPATGSVVSMRNEDGEWKAPDGGNPNPVPGWNCYDSDETPPVYALSTSALANTPGCELRIKASF